MSSKSFYRNIFELNLAVLFISTSGVLGRYIDVPVPIIICLRALIACALLFAYCKVKKVNFSITFKDRLSVLLGGIFLGLHWITFFYALKLSNVAIGMISLYTFPVITTILEPVITKSKFQIVHVLLGVMVIFGIYLLAPKVSFESEHFKGICFGVISALCYSVRNIMLKPQVKKYNQSVLMFNQLSTVAILLLPTLYFLDSSKIIDFLPETILLGVLTTAIGHTLFVYSLKNFSTSSASLISSLQPIYAIILAVIFLKEYPNINTLLGGLVIVSTVLVESYRIKQKQ